MDKGTNRFFLIFVLYKLKMILYLHPRKQGTLAQMVEQWTENPCVPGSIPGGTTKPE
jgi:5-methylthioribose kinase